MIEYILSGITEGIAQTTLLEWVAVLSGIASVYFSMRQNILVYPTGIISVLIYVYISANYKLYAETGVNTYYFLMSVYGWYHWKDTKGVADQIPITKNNLREQFITVTILVGSFRLREEVEIEGLVPSQFQDLLRLRHDVVITLFPGLADEPCLDLHFRGMRGVIDHFEIDPPSTLRRVGGSGFGISGDANVRHLLGILARGFDFRLPEFLVIL